MWSFVFVITRHVRRFCTNLPSFLASLSSSGANWMQLNQGMWSYFINWRPAYRLPVCALSFSESRLRLRYSRMPPGASLGYTWRKGQIIMVSLKLPQIGWRYRAVGDVWAASPRWSDEVFQMRHRNQPTVHRLFWTKSAVSQISLG